MMPQMTMIKYVCLASDSNRQDQDLFIGVLSVELFFCQSQGCDFYARIWAEV